MKYSVVLPTLDGGDYLKQIIQKYLKFKRDDIEFIVSDNLSNDGTFEYLSKLNDSRFKIFQPNEKLTLHHHLDFAYSHATGEWQSHIGNDDILLENNFEIKDFLIEKFNCEVFKFGYYRYHWPDELNSFKGHIDDFNFKMGVQVFDGKDFYRYLIGNKSIGGGGSWLVKKNIKEDVIAKAGYYAAEGVEFFAYRSSCFFAKQVCVIDAPIYIMGRAPISSGAQLFNKKSSRKEHTFSENFEWVKRLNYSPFPTRTVATVSLNGALNSNSKFKVNSKFNWLYWINAVIHDFRKLQSRNRTNRSLFSELLSGFMYGIKNRNARGNISIFSWLFIYLRLPYLMIVKLLNKDKKLEVSIDYIEKVDQVFDYMEPKEVILNNLESITELSKISNIKINKNIVK